MSGEDVPAVDAKSRSGLALLARSQTFPVVSRPIATTALTPTRVITMPQGANIRALIQAQTPLQPAPRFVAVQCVNGHFVPLGGAATTPTTPASPKAPSQPTPDPPVAVESGSKTTAAAAETTKPPTSDPSSRKDEVCVGRKGTTLIKELQRCIYPNSSLEWDADAKKAAAAGPSKYLSGAFTSALAPLTPLRKRKSHFKLGREQRRKNRQTIGGHLDQFNTFLRGMGLELELVKIKELSSQPPVPSGASAAAVAAAYQLSIEKERLPDKKLLYKVLKWKDAFNISDFVYHNLVRSLDLRLPKIDLIRQFRKRLDAMNHVYENELGYYICVHDKLRNIIENLIKTKTIDDSERVIKIKLCGDGTNCGNFKKIFNFNFAVLNESICKSAKGHYTIGVFEIANENYKELSVCLAGITRELREIRTVEVEGRGLYEVRMFMGGDLKFLASVYGINAANSMYPCLWCKCPKSQFHDFGREWSFVDEQKGARRLAESRALFADPSGPGAAAEKRLGYIHPAIIDFIDFDMCVVDMLHLFMRICDKLIELLLARVRLVDMPELQVAAAKRASPSKPKSTKKARGAPEVKVKVKVDEEESANEDEEPAPVELDGADEEAEVVVGRPTLHANADLKKFRHFSRLVEFIQTKMKIRKPYYFKDGKPYIVDLSGERKLKLFLEVDLVSLYPEYEHIASINQIWKLFYKIYTDVKRNMMDYADINREARDWGRLFLSVYESKHITPYIHIFITHLGQFVQQHKDVNSFNMQGLEKLNDLTTKQYFQATNKREKEFLRQILNKRNRIEYLSIWADSTEPAPDLMGPKPSAAAVEDDEED